MKKFLLLALALLAVMSCAQKPRPSDEAGFVGGAIGLAPTIDRALTYYADVKPIMEARCATCHVEGGSAPYALTSYEQVRDRSASIRAQVEERRMPPFLGLRECAEYSADWSLTEEQRGIITSWVSQGAPEGDTATPGVALDRVVRDLSRVDLTLTGSEPYTPKAGTDDYRCLVLDWPLTSPSFVTGFGAVPGHVDEVHHILAFAISPDQVPTITALDEAEDGPGYSCFGGPGVAREKTQLLGAWVPGVGAGDFPVDTGMLVLPGSKIVMQMHYNNTGLSYELHGAPAPDQTKLQFKIDATVAKPARTIPVVNPTWVLDPKSMMIPAGEKAVTHSYTFDPTLLTGEQPFELHRAVLHQHVLGTRSRLTLIRPGGEQCLVDIPRWDFHWQMNYEFAHALQVKPGDKVRIDCEWDNGPDKQALVDGSQSPPRDVTWGEGTRDEMCLGGLFISF